VPATRVCREHAARHQAQQLTAFLQRLRYCLPATPRTKQSVVGSRISRRWLQSESSGWLRRSHPLHGRGGRRRAADRIRLAYGSLQVRVAVAWMPSARNCCIARGRRWSTAAPDRSGSGRYAAGIRHRRPTTTSSVRTQAWPWRDAASAAQQRCSDVIVAVDLRQPYGPVCASNSV
jgi:hypothetical protein